MLLLQSPVLFLLWVVLLGHLATGRPIKVVALNSVFEMSGPTLEGARIAVRAFNKNNGIGGRLIELVETPMIKSPPDFEAAVARAVHDSTGGGVVNNTDIYGAIGIISDTAMKLALPTLEKHNIISFGYTVIEADLPRTRNAMFTHTNSYYELLSLVEHLVISRRLRRLGLVDSVAFGNEKSRELAILLRGYGLSVAGIFRELEGTPGFDYDAEWRDFVHHNAQAVLIFSRPSMITTRFIRDALDKLSDGRQIVVATSYVLSISVRQVTRELYANAAIRARLESNALVLVCLGHATGSHPYRTLELFREQYREYAASPGGMPPLSISYEDMLNDDAMSMHLAGGWLAMQVFIQTLRVTSEATALREMFKPEQLVISSFTQRIYNPGGNNGSFTDVGFGIYSDDINAFAEVEGIESQALTSNDRKPIICNQGSHNIAIAELPWGTAKLKRLMSKRTQFADCEPLNSIPRRAVLSYIPRAPGTKEGEAFSRSFTLVREFYKVHDARVNPADGLYLSFEAPYSYENVSESINSPSHRELWAVRNNNFYSAIAIGPMMIPLPSAMQDTAIVEPLPQLSMPKFWFTFKRSIVHVTSILELDLYALSAYIAISSGGRLLDDATRVAAKHEDVRKLPLHVLIYDRLDDAGASNYPESMVSDMAEYINAFLATQLLEPAEAHYSPLNENLETFLRRKELPRDALIFLFGIHITDVPSLLDYLKRFPRTKVLLPFTELLRIYDALIAQARGDLDSLKQIIFATSLPPWMPPNGNRAAEGGGTSTVGVVMQTYYDRTKNHTKLRHPMTLRAYIVERFLQEVSIHVEAIKRAREKGMPFETQQMTSEALLDSIYRQRYVTLDESLILGPYYDLPCMPVDDGSSTSLRGSIDRLVSEAPCERSWAAARMYVRSLAAAIDRNVAEEDFVYEPNQIRIYPNLPAKEESSLVKALVIGLALGATLFAIIGVALYCYLRKGKRDVRNAPKDPSQAVTILFTDIQSSTSLWAEIADIMGPALDAHHSMIRDLIAEHNGYEVKTIGDAFMIAFKSAADAVTFAHSLQFTFYERDWGGHIIDETYHLLEMASMENIQEENDQGDLMIHAMLPNGGAAGPLTLEKEDSKPELADIRIRYLTCHLSSEQYQKSWNGLRVRIGINTGFADIKLDEITHGYDYYGSVTNVASRTEACAWGGQVVITDATKQALVRECQEKGIQCPFEIASFGPQVLRGVTDPIVLHQVYNVPGRYFGPLRMDHVYAKDQSSNDGSTANGESASATAYSQQAELRDEDLLAGFAFFLMSTLFSPIGKNKKESQLEGLCRVWRLRPSRRRALKMMRSNKFMHWRAIGKHDTTIVRAFTRSNSVQSSNNTSGPVRQLPAVTSMEDSRGAMDERLVSVVNTSCNVSVHSMDANTSSDQPLTSMTQGALPNSSIRDYLFTNPIAPIFTVPTEHVLNDDPSATSGVAAIPIANTIEDLTPGETELLFLAGRISNVAFKQLPQSVKQILAHSRKALTAASNNGKKVTSRKATVSTSAARSATSIH